MRELYRAGATSSATRSRGSACTCTLRAPPSTSGRPFPRGSRAPRVLRARARATAVVLSPGGAYGPEWRRLVPHRADHARGTPARTGAASGSPRSPEGLPGRGRQGVNRRQRATDARALIISAFDDRLPATRPPAGVLRGRGPPEEEGLEELAELLRTAGVEVVGTLTQRRTHADPNTYLGPGKVGEAKEAARDCDANLVACDDELSARQERNLEQGLGLAVVDRTAIILDIFATHASSAEGKLQVELAQLEYNLARMRGLWSHLERLGGGIGTRGPGESQIETDRRLARDRIAKLRRRLERVRGVARRDARRARAHRAAADRARRLHQRRQVHAPERHPREMGERRRIDASQRQRGARVQRAPRCSGPAARAGWRERRRPALSHARSDHAGDPGSAPPRTS